MFAICVLFTLLVLTANALPAPNVESSPENFAKPVGSTVVYVPKRLRSASDIQTSETIWALRNNGGSGWGGGNWGHYGSGNFGYGGYNNGNGYGWYGGSLPGGYGLTGYGGLGYGNGGFGGYGYGGWRPFEG